MPRTKHEALDEVRALVEPETAFDSCADAHTAMRLAVLGLVEALEIVCLDLERAQGFSGWARDWLRRRDRDPEGELELLRSRLDELLGRAA